MFRNPLIERYSYSVLRLSQVWIYGGIYMAVAVLIVLLNVLSFITYPSNGEILRALYIEFLAIEFFILCIWTTGNSLSIIHTEVAQKSYDFLRMLPIRPLPRAFGLLIGRNLLTLFLAGINLVLVMALGLMSGVDLPFQAELLILLMAAAWFLNTSALLLDMSSPRSNSSLIIIILSILLIPGFMGGAGMLSRQGSASETGVPFFGLAVPPLLFASALCLYFGTWSLVGIVRRFNREHEPLFSRKGAILFVVGFQIILLGVGVGLLRRYFSDLIIPWLTASLIPLILVPVGGLRTLDQSIERLRSDASSPRSLRSLFGQSNVANALVLFVIWMISYISISAILEPGVIHACVLFSFYLPFALMIEVYGLYHQRIRSLAVLLGFVALLHTFLPMILAGILDVKDIGYFSVLGYVSLIESPYSDIGGSLILGIVALNLCLAGTLAVIVRKEWKAVVRALGEIRQG